MSDVKRKGQTAEEILESCTIHHTFHAWEGLLAKAGGGENEMTVADALELIIQYGGIDGGHHKQWVLDQLVRILTVTETGYARWVKEYSDGEDGDETYTWDEGIAP